jgi:rhamnosyltransferase
MSKKISIILRSYNDMPLIIETLKGIKTQTMSFELIALDNESKDGTADEVKQLADKFFNIPAGTYIPGKVLNKGMSESNSDIVVFLNSDCTPQHPEWLENLVRAFDNDKVAAVFGRQVPRPDCYAIFKKDTEDTYGNGEKQKYWKHCFSMASSAISRKVWEQHPFREDIQYSEDIDWTWRMRQNGYKIAYVPDSIVMHSHNYSLKQFYKRQFGEGKADAQIFTWSNWEQNWIRYSFLPLLRQIFSDLKFSFRSLSLSLVFQTFPYRITQMLGRRKGFLEGLEKDEKE